MRDAGREEVQRRAAVRRPIALGVRGQRGSGAQIRADQQWVDDAGGGAGVGKSLVAARCHARERERGTAEHLRERRDLVDVGGGVATDAIGIGPIGGVDLIAANQLAIRAGDAEVSRDRLESVSRKLARREIVAAHGVERVDELAPGRDEVERDGDRRHRSTCRAARDVVGVRRRRGVRGRGERRAFARVDR